MKLGIMTYKEINPSHFGSNPVDTQINLDLNLGSILVEVSVMRLALAVVHCLRVHLVVVVTSDKGGGKCVCPHYDHRYTSLSCQMRHNKFLFTSLQYKKNENTQAIYLQSSGRKSLCQLRVLLRKTVTFAFVEGL